MAIVKGMQPIAYLSPIPSERPSACPLIEESNTYDSQDIKGFISSYSTLPKLAGCLRQQHCKSRLCIYCSFTIAKRTKDQLVAYGEQDQSVLFAVFSVQSDANLRIAYTNLSNTLKAFTASSWLTSRCRAYLRQIEVVFYRYSGLWHPHVNVIVYGSPTELEALQEAMLEHWLASADQARAVASAKGQSIEITSNLERVAFYASKSLMTPSKSPAASHTPRDIVSQAACGDADARDRWEEIESLFRTRPRLVSKGGGLRNTSGTKATRTPRTGRPPRYSAEDLNRLRATLSIREQAAALGCSEATIHRLRRAKAAQGNPSRSTTERPCVPRRAPYPARSNHFSARRQSPPSSLSRKLASDKENPTARLATYPAFGRETSGR